MATNYDKTSEMDDSIKSSKTGESRAEGADVKPLPVINDLNRSMEHLSVEETSSSKNQPVGTLAKTLPPTKTKLAASKVGSTKVLGPKNKPAGTKPGPSGLKSKMQPPKGGNMNPKGSSVVRKGIMSQSKAQGGDALGKTESKTSAASTSGAGPSGIRKPSPKKATRKLATTNKRQRSKDEEVSTPKKHSTGPTPPRGSSYVEAARLSESYVLYDPNRPNGLTEKERSELKNALLQLVRSNSIWSHPLGFYSVG